MIIQHIACALDLSTIDHAVLKYINLLLSVYPKAKVDCTHVMPEFDLATALYQNDHAMLEATAEQSASIEAIIKEKVLTHIDRKFQEQVLIHVQDGSVLEKLIHFAGKTEYDLLVLGREKNKAYYGRLAQELIRRGSCNILLVPDSPIKTPRKILVPIDFSDNSLRAYESAVHFANALPMLPEIHCLNLYEIPEIDALYMGFPPRSEAFKTEVKKATAESYQTFLKKSKATLRNGKSPTFTALNVPQTRYAEGILHHADTSESDFIIMGAKGHSSIERFFLGSVVAKMNIINEQYPLMVVK